MNKLVSAVDGLLEIPRNQVKTGSTAKLLCTLCEPQNELGEQEIQCHYWNIDCWSFIQQNSWYQHMKHSASYEVWHSEWDSLTRPSRSSHSNAETDSVQVGRCWKWTGQGTPYFKNWAPGRQTSDFIYRTPDGGKQADLKMLRMNWVSGSQQW